MIEPPVSVRPFDEARPAVDTPPVKVEVAAPVTESAPVERLVDVAFVVVEFSAVKFWRVVDPVTRSAEEKIEVPLLPTMVVVAEEPTYIVDVAEMRVDEAKLRVARPLTVTAPLKTFEPVKSWLLRFKSATFGESAASEFTQTLLMAKQPCERLKPLFAVEVAPDEMRRLPPVIERPFDAASDVAPMPPEKVEVAVEVLRIEPAVMVRPLVEESPPAPVEAIPPANVDVALLPTMVVVAVPPMVMPEIAESRVVEAFVVVKISADES